MLKQETINIEDSNIANYGSQMHEDAKEAKARAEKEWAGAGQKVGIETWRVEKLAVKRFEPVGTFYNGDSFIVLHTYKKDPSSANLSYDLFFWLGEKTTQDEWTVAAYKTVELDDYLEGKPVQYRETQGAESSTFLQIFPHSAIRILDGGVDSGFNFTKPDEYKPRLLHLKGKKYVRVSEVPCKASSLNAGDVFVLDAGLEVYSWCGPDSGIFEKRKGNEIVEDLQSERNGKPKEFHLDGLEENEKFWSLLGGKPAQLASATPDQEVKSDSFKTLLEISDDSGSVSIKEIASGQLSKAALNSSNVFCLDIGKTLYVWVGKQASVKEKKSSMLLATKYLQGKGRERSCPIVRELEGAETAAFNALF